MDTGLPRSGVRSSLGLLTSGPPPRSSLSVLARGTCSPSAAALGSRSAAWPAQAGLLFQDSRLLPAAGGPTSILWPLGQPRWTGRYPPSAASFCPFLTSWGRDALCRAPNPFNESSLAELQCWRHWGSLRGLTGTPALATAPPSRAQSAGRVPGAAPSVWPGGGCRSEAALLAGRALPQSLERSVPLRKSTHTRKERGSFLRYGLLTAQPHRPFAAHRGGSRRDRASGRGRPGG